MVFFLFLPVRLTKGLKNCYKGQFTISIKILNIYTL